MKGSNTVQPIRDPEKIREIKSILKNQSNRNYFLFVFGINSGLRISDILPLKVKDVKERNFIYVKEKKTKKKRKVRILFSLKEEIEKYIEGMDEEAFLFPSQKGNEEITRVQAYRILKSVSVKVGLEEIGTHTLRKTFGYHFYQATKDVAILQKIFNHDSPSVTLRYIGINEDMEAAAYEKWGGL